MLQCAHTLGMQGAGVTSMHDTKFACRLCLHEHFFLGTSSHTPTQASHTWSVMVGRAARSKHSQTRCLRLCASAMDLKKKAYCCTPCMQPISALQHTTHTAICLMSWHKQQLIPRGFWPVGMAPISSCLGCAACMHVCMPYLAGPCNMRSELMSTQSSEQNRWHVLLDHTLYFMIWAEW